MRSKLIGAAAFAMLFGGAALAQSTEIQNPGDQSSAQPAPPADQSCGQWGTNQGTGGTGQYETPPPETQQPPTYVSPSAEVQAQPQEKHRMTGWMLTAGLGADGYSGPLRHDVRTGFGWGVTGAVKPSKVFGIELGYSGSTSRFSDRAFVSGLNTSRGNDLIRNSGQIDVTLGLGAAPVQPYILGGLALDQYSVNAPGTFYRSTTSGSVPLGAGIQAHVGRFTADLRGMYSVLLTNDLTRAVDSHPVLGSNWFDAGRWTGTLNLGGTF